MLKDISRLKVPDSIVVDNPYGTLQKFGFKAKSQKEVSGLCVLYYMSVI